MTFLLDSDICIAIMKREQVATAKLKAFSAGELALPAIVLGELAHGASKSNNPSLALQTLALFSDHLPIVSFDFKAAHYYGRVKSILEKSGTPIGPNDYLIAATALANDATLITRNIKEFSRVPGLRWVTF